MHPELLLNKAINTLNRWNEEDPDLEVELKQINNAQISILEYALTKVSDRKNPVVRNAVALAYGILGVEEV